MEQKFLRTVRSFVLREGRMTEGQKNALDKHWPIYGLSSEQGPLDIAKAFGRAAPCVLEIGFGMGHSLIAQAQAHPDRNYIGIEVHRPGVGVLLKAIAEQNIQNIRAYNEDGVDVLKTCIADASLYGVQLYFPDPWHKKRHHKRRIVQSEFAELIRQKLQIGGFFHLATDWQNYAEHMMEVMSAAPGFRNRFGAGNYAPKGERPTTKFEQRGERLGHGVWDLMFERVA
jgi:tRNA (guanine-N7-)-methyltransferase